MTRFFAVLCVAFGLMTGAVQAAVEIGKPAPDFSFKDVNGVDRILSGFKGKTVVLEWTNPQCPFVKKFYGAGEMQRLQQDTLKDTNVVWFTINSSAEGHEGFVKSDEEAKQMVSAENAHATAYVRDVSGAFGKLYGAKTTPHMFVIDKDGNVAYQGAIDSIKSADAEDIKKADNYVVKTLEALKAGKAPAVTSTAPYGCAVKYAE